MNAPIDYTQSLRLQMRYHLISVRNLPFRGMRTMSKVFSKLVKGPTPVGPCVVKTVHGFNMILDPVHDRGVEREIFSAGTYEPGTLYALQGLLREGSTFVDVGANIGLMSLLAADIVGIDGQVIAFEAMPSTYEILQRNLELNGCRNVTALNLAVGATRKTTQIFYDTEMKRGAASLHPHAEGAKGVDIPMISLDEYLAENRIRTVDCVKVDVEGWELEVLRGAIVTLSSPDAPVWIIECSREHPTFAGTVEDMYDTVVNSNEYQVYRLSKGKHTASRLKRIARNELPDHDNLLCLLPKHVDRLPAHLRPY